VAGLFGGELGFRDDGCEGGSCAEGDPRSTGLGEANGGGFADSFGGAGYEDVFVLQVGFCRVDGRVDIVV
jgi:hypothetical protein